MNTEGNFKSSKHENENENGTFDNGGVLNNLKVLLVEDEELARNELSIFLKRRVGKLYSASNGVEALTVFHSNTPDLVITDLKMPVMGGIELIEEIRKTGSKCPVIVVSAMSDLDTILKAVDLGIVKYAIKPLDTNELVQLMAVQAIEILKSVQGGTIIGKSYVLEREDKRELEKSLKSEIAYFLKTFTGKGPREVFVFIKGNQIEVKATGVLTLLETNLVAGKRNYSMVDYNRSIFYQESAEELEKKMSLIMKTSVKLQQVKPNSAKDTDELNFLII